MIDKISPLPFRQSAGVERRATPLEQ